jgi:hypothetical protein
MRVCFSIYIIPVHFFYHKPFLLQHVQTGKKKKKLKRKQPFDDDTAGLSKYPKKSPEALSQYTEQELNDADSSPKGKKKKMRKKRVKKRKRSPGVQPSSKKQKAKSSHSSIITSSNSNAMVKTLEFGNGEDSDEYVPDDDQDDEDVSDDDDRITNAEKADTTVLSVEHRDLAEQGTCLPRIFNHLHHFTNINSHYRTHSAAATKAIRQSKAAKYAGVFMANPAILIEGTHQLKILRSKHAREIAVKMLATPEDKTNVLVLNVIDENVTVENFDMAKMNQGKYSMVRSAGTIIHHAS